MSICGVTVSFKYTRNLEQKDKFADELRKVNLYVFNSEGKLIFEDSISGNPSQINYNRYLRLEAGAYTLVAWGSNNINMGDDFIQSAPSDSLTFDDLSFSIKNIRDTVNKVPADLFYGLQQVTINPSDLSTNQTFTIDMMKDTKHVTVIASGVPIPKHENDDVYECTITSANGILNFRNEITKNVSSLHYFPDTTATGPGELTSKFVLMRELSTGTSAPILSFVRKSKSGDVTELIDPAKRNLTSLLIALANEHQKDMTNANSEGDKLDIDNDFTIKLYYDETNGGVNSIEILDWNGEPINTGIID
jgi:hypothetical protein